MLSFVVDLARSVPMAQKRKKKTTEEKSSPKAAPTALLKDGRVPQVLGLVCLILGLMLTVAFFSYLLTWREDQDKVFQFSWGMILNPEVQVNNIMGKFGAVLAHQFFYNWFGMASWVFVPVLFFTGARLAFKAPGFKLSRVYMYSFMLLVWCSIVFAFTFQVFSFPWGGAFGTSISQWLMSLMGIFGTTLLIIASILIFTVLKFNVDLSQLKMSSFKLENIKMPKAATQAAGKILDDDTEVKDWTRQITEENQDQEPTIVSKPEPEVEEEDEDDLVGATDFTVVQKQDKPKPEPAKDVLDLEVSQPIEEPEPPKEEPKAPDTQMEVQKVKEEKEAKEQLFDIGDYDPTLDLPDYRFPTLDLLQQHGSEKIQVDTAELEQNKNQIVETLSNYNIEISKIKATIGPTVTLYEIVPQAGVRISKIKNLEDDIALSLAALGIRIIAPIPGKGTIGIEVPNVKKEIVSMHTLIASEKFQNSKYELPVALGKTISNEIFIADLAKMPHMLMAGATGQGKSVGLNAMLVSLLYKKHPSQLKFVLVDPKKVELNLFSRIEKHYLAKLPGEEDAIITDTKKVIHTLNALCIEMDNRYDLLKNAQVRNIKEYNAKFVARRLNPEKGHQFLPYIVLVIDEFADLMMTAGKEVETPIARLAQLARAIGIHLIIATQRPSVNIITGIIKANFPARVAFKVTSKVDSRTILDTGGAEQLIGRGDMLLSEGGELTRLQCGFVDTPEVDEICDFVGDQRGYPYAFELPEYSEDGDGGGSMLDPSERDELFAEAARQVVGSGSGSTSMLQRKLKLGYNRAGRLMDQLEAAGIVGPSEGSKAREVIMDMYQLEQYLDSF